MSIYENIENELRKAININIDIVYCHICGRIETCFTFRDCLRDGFPTCCNFTMTLGDKPK